MFANKFKMLALLAVLALAASCGPSEKYTIIERVPIGAVTLTDGFWKDRVDLNNDVTIPHCFEQCEITGCIDFIYAAAGLKEGVQRIPGSSGNDTDVYKTIEAVAYALQSKPYPELEAYADKIIDALAEAQEEDGFLQTGSQVLDKDKPHWEIALYCSGHMYEAGVAYYQATGKRKFLDICIKNADLVCETYGPGKKEEPSHHPEVEIGLVKLYKVTGDQKYLDLAKFLFEMRGVSKNGRELGGEYNQDHKPILEQEEIIGHAVCANYLCTGLAEYVEVTGDTRYLDTLEKLWQSVADAKLYITGGLGSYTYWEAYSANYHLPNLRAYCESCASVAGIFWTERMFLHNGDSKYIDMLERILYNAMLASTSAEGNMYFYRNVLESVGQTWRQTWYDCACCPPNIARFFASLQGYIYAKSGDRVYVNLFIPSEAAIELNGKKVKVALETLYPWEGAIRIAIEPETDGEEFEVSLRIPVWATGKPVGTDLYRYAEELESEPTLAVNGETVEITTDKGYVTIKRAWKKGDAIELNLPMQLHRVLANENVEFDRGRVALERGPIVFCVDCPDVENGHVRNLQLKNDAELVTEFDPDLFNGVQVVRGRAIAHEYRNGGSEVVSSEREFTATPYYTYSNRGVGEMLVWLPCEDSAVCPREEPTIAMTSKVTSTSTYYAGAANDRLEPQHSNDRECPPHYWWPQKGTTEWVQYDFDGPKTVSETEVYWFERLEEDSEFHRPKSWRILYKDGDEWLPVHTLDEYGIELDKFNRVTFEPVRTTAVRLEVQSVEGYCAGLYEWKVK